MALEQSLQQWQNICIDNILAIDLMHDGGIFQMLQRQHDQVIAFLQHLQEHKQGLIVENIRLLEDQFVPC